MSRLNSSSFNEFNPVTNASPTQAVMTKYRREHDRLLPIANIGRIMQRACPLLIQGFPPCKISKEAKEGMQDCVSDFIGFVTSEAADRLQEDKRKTITADDVLASIRALGFDAYLPLLEVYLQKLRETRMREAAVSKRPRKQRYFPTADFDEPRHKRMCVMDGEEKSYSEEDEDYTESS
eukprot:55844_1